MDLILKLARRVIKFSQKLIVCKCCGQRLQFRLLIDHVVVNHREIDVTSQCLFCLQRFRDNRYEKHFKSCFKKKPISIKMMYRQKMEPIDTATAKRVLNVEHPVRQSVTRFETEGGLPPAIEWEHATNVVDLLQRPIVVESTPMKEIIATQEDKLETLRMATNVLLSFHPKRWYHLMVSEKHVATLQNLLRGRTDMFVPHFGCWCKSPSLLSQENLKPEKVLHYHMLLYTENPDWKKEIWNPLVSNDRNRYKVYRAIEDPKHLCNVLLYISQKRSCKRGGAKHFDIQRPILGEAELLVKLANPVVCLEEINNLMSTNIASFDLHKTYDQHNNLVYYTPLKSMVKQIKHFNLPIFRGFELRLDTVVGERDFTLTYTQDGRFVNMVPGEAQSTVTVADVLTLAYPDINVVWTRKLHTVAHNMFTAAQNKCPRCFPSECGIEPLKFRPIEEDGELVLTFAVKKFRNVIQVGLYGRGEVILNVFVNDKPSFYLNKLKRLAISPQQLREHLSALFGDQVTLIAKNEEPFRFLQAIAPAVAPTRLINAEPILKNKFENRQDLEECAEFAGYDEYELPEDAGCEAKLLYELLSLESSENSGT